jgi:hypothetical protein
MESIKQEKSNLMSINPISKHMSTPINMGGSPYHKHEEGHGEERFGNVAGAASNAQRLKDAKQFVKGSTPKQKLKIGAAGRAVYENATPKKGSGTIGFKPSKNAFKTVAEGSKDASVSSRFSGDAIQEMNDKTSTFRRPGEVTTQLVLDRRGSDGNTILDASQQSFKDAQYKKDKKSGMDKYDFQKKEFVPSRISEAFSNMAYKRLKSKGYR